MSFKRTNVLAAFMDLMNIVLKQYLDLFVIVFINYMPIYSWSEEDHATRLLVIVEILKNLQLLAKFTKCAFLLESISLLCHVVSGEGI